MYKWDVLKRVEFNLPVISIGNMTIGGTGKSPHIEYLVRLLQDHIQIATLSRGYGRKTKGFRWVSPRDSSLDVGDEPLQFAQKFPKVRVAVGENRVLSIIQMLKEQAQLQTILLDDAFQHLAVKPGLNVLLTEYNRPFHKDFLLPSGRLREWASAHERADIVIVSKCPEDIEASEVEQFRKKLKLIPSQSLYFSKYSYGSPYFILDRDMSVQISDKTDILVVSAIANTDYLMDYLHPRSKVLKAMDFEDHHYFTRFEMGQIVKAFTHLGDEEKIIITTEKDATRLLLHRDFIIENKLPIFVLPVEVEFFFGGSHQFDLQIKDFLVSFES